MNLYDSTAAVLKYGSALGILITAVGLILGVAEISIGDDVLWFGILVLVLSPLFGILISTTSMCLIGDWKWVAVAAILLAVIAAGSVVAWVL